MGKSISFLIAAGFSAPKGYPVGWDLNSKIQDFDRNSVGFSPSGMLCYDKNTGKRPDFGWRNPHDDQYDMCIDIIDYYKMKHKFDYEEFYDYLLRDAIIDPEVKKIAEPYIQGINNLSNLINGISNNIYSQIVAHLIVDKNGENRYDKNDTLHFSSEYGGYSGILNLISNIDKDYVVHIHTLNHDMLFESFNNTMFFNKEKISDGFNLLKSKYYSYLSVEEKDDAEGYANHRRYLCKVEKYTGRYTTRFRLYKLHGSINYYRYYRKNKKTGFHIPDAYLKHVYGLDTNFHKECKNNRGIWEFIPSFMEYHADFLTGTTAKILRYKEPLLYKKLFKKFINNLKNSEKLIIIGYGAKDSEVNDMIKNSFDYKNKPVYIVDPFITSGTPLDSFAKEIKAKVIKKQLEIISESDFF